MKPGHESQTAVMVCMARALAHGHSPVARFSDPTALTLLPDGARRRVEALRGGMPPRTRRERIAASFTQARSYMMVARTVAVDDAIRAAHAPQLVILGAGLDGRAWRMPELHDVVVFEVDHPDSQRVKRDRAAALEPLAREIRFVPVDFTRDDLDVALAKAGHDAVQPTTWVWEGVTMYLAEDEIERTLAIIVRRSAPASRIAIVYATSSLALTLIGLVLRRAGEPVRSKHQPEEMRALLAAHGFRVTDDRGLPEIGAALSPALARPTRLMKHLRLVVAERGGSATRSI